MAIPDDGVRIHHRACNLCEAICGIAIEHDGAQVLAIRPDRDDPFSRGHICPKAVALKDLHEDPDRLRKPLRRRGNDFEEVGWEEALTEIGERLVELRRRHGRDAVGVYVGNPAFHSYGTLLYATLVLPRVLRTRNRFSATSVDQLPRMLSSLLMFGHQILLPVPDLDRTDYLMILGANPVTSNGSLMTAPDVTNRLKALRRRGGKLVVLDPRRTETAALADEYHAILPGRDAYFLLGMLHTLFDEGLVRPGRLESHLDGMADIRAMASRYAPERVSSAAGIDPSDIRRLSRELAAAPSAACYGRVGTCLQEFGALTTWLVDLVNILTGNLDRPGGWMFSTPAADLVKLAARTGMAGSYDTHRSRVRGLPEFGGELPVAVMAEEMDTPGEGQLRALITVAGNPVLSTPNGTRLDQALGRLDLIVAVDPYLNETTRHAHFILPPTSSLEHDNYDLALNAVGIRDTAKYTPALFDPPDEAKDDWEIMHGLATQICAAGRFGRIGAGLSRGLGRMLTPERVLDILLRLGPYGDRFNPWSKRLNLRRLKAAEHGIDFGPLQPRLPGRLNTPGKRIRLAPPPLVADVDRLERRLAQTLAENAAPASDRPLLLIGRRHLRSNNSWMHNSQRLMRGRDRCTLLMNPQDAALRGFEDGQLVCIRSRVGKVEAPLEVRDEVMPGVVSLPHGWGHNRMGTRLGIASQRPGVSVNDLTDELLVDELSGNACLNGVSVSVTA